jgi:hypothetical protein
VVPGIDGRDRGKAFQDYTDCRRFRIILVRHLVLEKVVELSIPIP